MLGGGGGGYCGCARWVEGGYIQVSQGAITLCPCCFAQDYPNWELLIVGDHCPVLDAYMEQQKQAVIGGWFAGLFGWQHGAGGRCSLLDAWSSRSRLC